jgi:hypothetical protein
MDETAQFYEALGFVVGFKDDGWMILNHGALELEFFPRPDLPRGSGFSACLRVDDLDALYADFQKAGLAINSRAAQDRTLWLAPVPRVGPEWQHDNRSTV